MAFRSITAYSDQTPIPPWMTQEQYDRLYNFAMSNDPMANEPYYAMFIINEGDRSRMYKVAFRDYCDGQMNNVNAGDYLLMSSQMTPATDFKDAYWDLIRNTWDSGPSGYFYDYHSQQMVAGSSYAPNWDAFVMLGTVPFEIDGVSPGKTENIRLGSIAPGDIFLGDLSAEIYLGSEKVWG